MHQMTLQCICLGYLVNLAIVPTINEIFNLEPIATNIKLPNKI